MRVEISPPKGAHPEGTPKAAVSKDGHEKTANQESFSNATALPLAAERDVICAHMGAFLRCSFLGA
jgi:hypothetical protein